MRMMTTQELLTRIGNIRKLTSPPSPGETKVLNVDIDTIVEIDGMLTDIQMRMTTLAPDIFCDIAAFHRKFDLEYSGPPRQLDVDLGVFRTKFMMEELLEYVGITGPERKAFEEALVRHIPEEGLPPLEAQLDALVDLVYVAVGTAYLHGFNFDEAWRRVQAANMAKVRARRDGGDSARGSPFDVVKPVGWRPADLSDLVKP